MICFDQSEDSIYLIAGVCRLINIIEIRSFRNFIPNSSVFGFFCKALKSYRYNVIIVMIFTEHLDHFLVGKLSPGRVSAVAASEGNLLNKANSTDNLLHFIWVIHFMFKVDWYLGRDTGIHTRESRVLACQASRPSADISWVQRKSSSGGSLLWPDTSCSPTSDFARHNSSQTLAVKYAFKQETVL